MAKQTLTAVLTQLNNQGIGNESLEDGDDSVVIDTQEDDEEVYDEGAEMDTEVAPDNLEQELSEGAEEVNAKDNLVAAVDTAEESAEGLEALLEEAAALESYGGWTPELAHNMEQRATLLSRPVLGEDFGPKHMPSIESFDLPGSRPTSTAVAVEGIKETLQRIISAIVGAIQKVISWVKDIWKRMTDANHAFLRRIEKIREKVDAIKKGKYKLPENPEDVKVSKSDVKNMMKGKKELQPIEAISTIKQDVESFNTNWDVKKIASQYNRFVEVQQRYLKIGFDRAQKHDATDVIEAFKKFNDTLEPYGSNKALEYKGNSSDEAKKHIDYKLCQVLVGGKQVSLFRTKTESITQMKATVLEKGGGFWKGVKDTAKYATFQGKQNQQSTGETNTGFDMTAISGARLGYVMEDDSEAPEKGKETTVKPLSLGDIETALRHAEDIQKLNAKILYNVDDVEKNRKKAMSAIKSFMAEIRSINNKAEGDEAAARKVFTANLAAARKIAVSLTDPAPELVKHSITCAKAVLDICDKSLKGSTKVKDGKDDKKDGDKKKK